MQRKHTQVRRDPERPAHTVSGTQMSRVLRRLRRQYDVEQFVKAHGVDPYRILIGCVLSLRTRDEVSFPATDRLFARATTPAAMLRLRESTISRLIHPVGFFRRKATQIRGISRQLLSEHDSLVPQGIEELLALPGVGRKTANLVITLGFGKPGICVDVHVHRICNRLGWLQTADPEATEWRLRDILPRSQWIPINEILVRHGQNVCKPLSPLCSTCVVREQCRRIGVARSR